MKFILIFALTMLAYSCQRVVDDNSVVLKDGKTYLKSADKPFTGTVVSKKNNGTISSKNSYVNGIKSGKWFVYGHEGEIVQHGEYINASEINSPILSRLKCERIQINRWHEGDIEYVDVFFISLVSLLSDELIKQIIKVFEIEFPNGVGHLSLYSKNDKVVQIYPVVRSVQQEEK